MVKLADGKDRKIVYIATTTYWGPDGKPMSAKEFLERLFGDLSNIVTDEDQLRAVWSDPDNRQHFLAQLADRGYDAARLDAIRLLVDAPDSDLFDVLGYVLFTNDPKTRQDRAEHVSKTGLKDAGGEMREFLLGILSAYAAHSEAELAPQKLTAFMTARYGSVSEGKAKLGEVSKIRDAYRGMQADLYAD